MAAQFTVPYKCGKTGAQWRAYLEPRGPKLGFARFVSSDEEVQTAPLDRKAEILRRFQELNTARPPLPPPQSAQVVEVDLKRELTSDDITPHGFQCPSCRDGGLLLCAECCQYSCRGGRDGFDRYLCQWCGETLVTRALTPEEAQQPRPPLPIEGQQKTLQVRVRELTSGSEAP